ncbi:MAG: hypothetical protein KAT65_24865 [Methanophagales archaeon]|nr:hypothetical protein [Methanophagales archaeon]
MKKLDIFFDTCIINRILYLDKRKSDAKSEEDREYLDKILNLCAEEGKINFFVNPSVKTEITNTTNKSRREKLLKVCSQYNFNPFNKTILPFSFPATFISDEEVEILNALCEDNPALKKDIKIIADSAFCEEIDVLLTTDREHLAGKEFHLQHLEIFTPKELFEYLSKTLEIKP